MKIMFVLVCAVGVDLGFVAVAVVIYCFRKTSCAVGFKFRVFKSMYFSCKLRRSKCLYTLTGNGTEESQLWRVFFRLVSVGLVLVEENYCESSARVMMRSAL